MATEDEPPVEVRNYTPFWSLERKIYSFYDVQLPFPISLTLLGVFLAVGIPWGFLMWALQVPLTPPWFLIWLVPPGFVAWASNKPIFEGKTLIEFVRSRVKHLTENRKYKRLEPDLTKYDDTILIEQNISTKNDINPSPF